jgi:N,N'-diacetyllegionaminate synthase
VKKVFVIAEAGVNHNGSLQLAKQLIDAAVNAGVDAVKFQTWKTELIVTKSAKQAMYQMQNTGLDEPQFDMLKKLELTYDEFRALKKYSDEKKIIFMSTPDEIESATFLSSLQKIFKIGSGEITNLPYLRHIGKLGKEVILSTGMANLGEIEDALDVLVKAGTPKDKITVLHATTEYPCPMDEVNLRAMQSIQSAFGVSVGYSDHTQGIEIPIAAVALGATVIEKHFTLNRNLQGPDHKASLEPEELKSMVVAIRNIELALGDGIKRLTSSEARNKQVARKSLVASREIKSGEVFTAENLTSKRPGTGISPMRWDEVLGKNALRDFTEDELIDL